MLIATGCSLNGPRQWVGSTTPAADAFTTPVAEPPGTGRSAADDLFANTPVQFGAPVAGPVSVFGEIDGMGPSGFETGKAGFVQHTFVDEGYDADTSISPDGTTLLFASTRHSARPDIYIQRVNGQAVTQLTDDPADDAFPTFSPTQDKIAFASNRAGSWDIYVMNADGTGVRQVTHGAAHEISPSFSPDGTQLIYSALGSRSGQWELWLVDLNSGRQSMVGYGLFPKWSPAKGSNQIVFQRARQRGTRWFSIWTLELEQGEARNQTEIAFSSTSALVTPTWSRDGSQIAFCSIEEPTISGGERFGRQTRGTTQDVWIVAADGTNKRRLTDGRGINAQPTFSPDGRVYFVSDRGGAEAIWSVSGISDSGPATASVDTHE